MRWSVAGPGKPVVGAGLAVLVAVTLAGCAGPSSTDGAGAPVEGFAGFTSCVDVPMIAADPALYRDEPQYGNPMELVDAVQSWASGQAGFEQLWIDRDRHGWVTVGFAGADVAALQAEVGQEFPGEGVVVVELPHSQAYLSHLADRVAQALSAAGAMPSGYSADVPRGLVSLSGVPGTVEAEGALREFAGEPICVDVVDPAALVPEGEQPTGGEGWRLLGHAEGAGEPYRTGVATTDDQLAALWAESGLTGEVPEVDWRAEIAVWFGAVYGSSCPVRLDGVVVEGATLHGTIVVPGSGPGTACNADANPHSYLVAVQRSQLPRGPFVVQLSASDPPPGAPLERTIVDADLSAPGATATDEQIHPDPDAGFHPGPLIEDGYDQMPEQGDRYLWRPRPECDGTVIGPIDGTLWRLADGEAAWDDSEELTLFPIDDDLMVISTPGMEYAFVRADDSACEG